MPLVCQDQLQIGKEQRFHRKDSIEWSLKDLSACMERLCGIRFWPCKFCFFIDGLDEYAGSAKEQSSMVEHLKRLTKGGDVKICVSSRPWNVFRSGYGGRGDPKIILQDHTKTDIDMYIEGQLEADARFRRLTSVQAEMGEFAREIRLVGPSQRASHDLPDTNAAFIVKKSSERCIPLGLPCRAISLGWPYGRRRFTHVATKTQRSTADPRGVL